MANVQKNNASPPLTRTARLEASDDFINVSPAGRIMSVFGGAALAYYGWGKKHTLLGKGLVTMSTYLLFRGISGFCAVNEALDIDHAHAENEGFEVSSSLTILKPRAEVFQFWRRLENLPSFMQYLEEVKQIDSSRSHWVAKIPKNIIAKEKLTSFEWDAEIVQEEENSRIVWRSLPDSEVENSGEVRFTDAPSNRGTEVQAIISYRAPGGVAGKIVAKLLNPAFRELVKQDVRRFKRLMEAGEISTIIGQPSGRKEQKY